MVDDAGFVHTNILTRCGLYTGEEQLIHSARLSVYPLPDTSGPQSAHRLYISAQINIHYFDRRIQADEALY